MTLHRKNRLVSALLALISTLFMQLAVAGYVCPGISTSIQNKTTSSIVSPMVNCDQMDMEQPGLCHAYSQDGKQSLDKPELPHVQPFVPVVFTAIIIATDTAILAPDTWLAPTYLAHATAPPLAIQHCCFRI
ncbi:hypothetical protein BH11PSE12_BH11PSE12_27100 [soil metagenome]